MIARENVQSPALIVIGEVVERSRARDMFAQYPMMTKQYRLESLL